MHFQLRLTVLIGIAFAFFAATNPVDLHALDAPGGIAIHGFISQGYLWTSDNNFVADTEDGTFEFNEFGINFNKNLSDNLKLGIQFLSRDFGDAGNNEVKVDWAYADYRWKNWLGFQAGIIRPSIGLFNEIRDLDALRTYIFLPQSVYDKNYWDRYSNLKGGGVYGDVDAGGGGAFYYRFLAGTYDLDEENGDSSILLESNGLGNIQSSDVDIFYNACLEWQAPLEGLRLRATWQYSSSGEVTGQSTLPPELGLPFLVNTTATFDQFMTTVLSAEYVWENLTVIAEYTQIEIEMNTTSTLIPPLDPLPPELALALAPTRLDQTSEGYYLGASYRFNDWFELGGYYSAYYPDKDDKDGDRFEGNLGDFNAWLNQFTLSLRFDINDNWIVKLEGHAVNGAANVLVIENPDGFEEDWYLFAAKTTFSF